MTEMTPQSPNGYYPLAAPRLRPWRELAILAFIFMEMSWIVLWCRIFIRLERAVPYEQAFAVMAGMLFAAYLLARLVDALDLKLPLRRGILFGLLVANLLVGLKLLVSTYRFRALNLVEFLNRPASTLEDIASLFPTEFILIAIVLLTWWRGISLVGKQIGPVNLISSFRTGVVAFFIYGLFLPLTGEPPGLALYLFLTFSLLGMSAARISVLSHLRGGQRIPFDRRWLGGITLVVLVVVGLSWLAVALMRGQAFIWLSNLYTWVVYILAILVSPLLLLFIKLILLLGEWLRLGLVFRSILNLISRIEEKLAEWIGILDRWFDNFDLASLPDLLRLLASSKTLILWASFLLAAALILLTMRRTIWKEDHTSEPELQALPNQPDLIELLRSALRRRLGKMVEGLGKAVNLRRAEQLLAAARIRRVYARLLNLSARLDQPRPVSRTPLEFLPDLEALFPAFSSDLTTITNAYLRVRYGELSESIQEVEAVEEAWKRIVREGRAQLAARRGK